MTIIEIEDIKNQTQNSTQSYLFNLIVYSTCKARTAELKTILTRITEKFPCRIIQIEKICEPNTDEIKVSLSKERSGKNGQITSDIIQIFVSESQMERVPFIILPNIVADLPVYLIFGDDPTSETKLLKNMQSFSTKLIFNAAWSGSLKDFSKRMKPFLQNLKIDFMDIYWALLNGWKELLAQVFDTPLKISHLRTCKKIIINYAYEKPEDLIEAIYLTAFIASRMGWEFKAQEIQHHHKQALCYQYRGHDINVILDPVSDAQAKAGSIINFELFAENATVYKLNSLKNSSKVLLHISSDEKCEIPCTFALSDINRGNGFLREVFYQSPGHHYAETLEMISKVNFRDIK